MKINISNKLILFSTSTIFLLVLLIIPTALSLTRTISSSQDNLDSFIVNSYGNMWEAKGTNIQAAIDNLSLSSPVHGGYGGPHGTVWLPPNNTYVIDSTLTIEEHVTLDMQGSTIIPSGDFDIFELRSGSKLVDGIINVSSVSDYDSAVITFRATDGIGVNDHVPRIRNIELISDGLRGKGIYINTQGSANQHAIAEFRNIKTRKFEYAILINHTSTGDAYLNGNKFSNIIGYGDKYFITAYEEVQEVASNYFYNIHYYCTDDTEYVIWNNGQGQIFDNVVVYNWDNKSGTRTAYIFNVSGYGDNEGGDSMFISFRGGADDLAINQWVDWENRFTLLNLETGNLSIGNKNV